MKSFLLLVQKTAIDIIFLVVDFSSGWMETVLPAVFGTAFLVLFILVLRYVFP